MQLRSSFYLTFPWISAIQTNLYGSNLYLYVNVSLLKTSWKLIILCIVVLFTGKIKIRYMQRGKIRHYPDISRFPTILTVTFNENVYLAKKIIGIVLSVDGIVSLIQRLARIFLAFDTFLACTELMFVEIKYKN